MAINFLNSILPFVYIKRIILENTSRSNFKERNPHIDHEREPNIIRNSITGKLEREIITPDLAKKNVSSDMLIINLDLLMKEKLDNSLISSWFGNEEIMKYLKVCIFQSLNEEITDKIISNQLEIDIFDLEKFNNIFPSSTNYETIFLKDIIKQPIQGKQILEGDSILDQYESYYDENGDKIIDIDFRVNFKIIDNANPKHLSYFVFSFLDVEQIAKDYKMNIPLGNFKTLKGKNASEIVLDNYEIVSETFIFFDETGAMWEGDIHKLENGQWKTGVEESENSKILQLKTITNTKIQDFRSLRELDKLELDFSFIENDDFFVNPIKVLTNDKLDIEKRINYFSSFSISRDSEGNCRFLFGIDYLRLIRDKTIFGKLYKNDDVELLKNVKIRNLKVYRVRLPNNYKTALINENGVSFFNEEEDAPELVVFSKEDRSGNFVTNTYNALNLEKTNIVEFGTIRELVLNLEQNNQGIRHFTGVDKQMKNVTFGFYKYYIELDIEDNTNQLLVSKLDDLIESYELLKEYYNEIDNFNNFDPYAGYFRNVFIEQQEKKFDNDRDPKNIPWIFPISSYLTTINLFSNRIDIEKYKKILLVLLHPRTGTLDGILIYIQLLETLIKKISSLVGSTVSGKVTKWKSGSKTTISNNLSRGGVDRKSFLIKFYSDNIFDADVPKEVGYDFLSISAELQKESNSDGLKVVTSNEYEKRTELETLKYFKNMNIDINLKTSKYVYTQDDTIDNTRYSFLSPSNINLGEYRKEPLLGQGEGLFNVRKYGTILTDIMRFNSLRNSPQVPFLGGATKFNLNNVGIKSLPKQNLDELKVTKNYNSFASMAGLVATTIKSTIEKAASIVNPYLNSAKKETKTSFLQGMVSAKIDIDPKNKFQTSLYQPTSLEKLSSMIKENSVKSMESIPSSLVEKALPHVSEEEIISYLAAVEDYVGTGSIFNREDILEEEYREFGISGKSKEQTLQQTKTNALMTMLFFPILEKGVKSDLNVDKKQNDVKKDLNTINLYNLNDSINAIDKAKKIMVTDFSSISTMKLKKMDIPKASQSKFPDLNMGYMNNVVKEQIKIENIKSLPNQIKSLFVSSIGSEKVIKNWFSGKERENNKSLDKDNKNLKAMDPLKDPDDSLVFKLNYNILRKVEVMIGYQIASSGNLIKEQIWQPLTKERLAIAKQGNLLCRLKVYENNDLNIHSPRGLDLPIYNEYFILTYNEEILNFKPISVKFFENKINNDLFAIHEQTKVISKIEYAQSLVMTKIKDKTLISDYKATDFTSDPAKYFVSKTSSNVKKQQINKEFLKDFNAIKFER